MIVMASVASAQVSLEVKYQDGTTYETQIDSKTTQTLTLAGMNLDTKSSTFIVSEGKVGTRNADGVLSIEEKMKTLQSELSTPGGMIQFDSANPDKKADNPLFEPLMDMFRSMYRIPVVRELDAKNKLVAIKLPEGEYEKLPDVVKDRYAPEALKKAGDQALNYLPDGPVKKGDQWERSAEVNLGAGQTMTFRTKYEYDGTVEKDGVVLDKIVGKSFDVSFAINGNPMFQLIKSDLKIIESASMYLFDRVRGHVVSHKSKTQIAGPLTLQINGMQFDGKVDLTIEESSSRQK